MEVGVEGVCVLGVYEVRMLKEGKKCNRFC